MKRTGPTNQELEILIDELRQLSLSERAPFWKRIATDLAKPTRQRRAVNLSRINRYAKSNETVVIPGKVLGTGDPNEKITVAAWQFSQSAKEKLKNNLTIKELMKKNPKAKKLKIIG
jgi:large subunit ribosomal protein L18e